MRFSKTNTLCGSLKVIFQQNKVSTRDGYVLIVVVFAYKCSFYCIIQASDYTRTEVVLQHTGDNQPMNSDFNL